METGYSLLFVGTITLTVLLGIGYFLLTRLGLLPAGGYQKGLATALLAVVGFTAGAYVFSYASSNLTIFLPRNVCLATAPVGRSCLFRGHTLLQIIAGLLGAIVAVSIAWKKDQHKALDRAAWRIWAAVLIPAAIASYLLATLDCFQLGIFCMQSEGVPDCTVLLLLVSGIIGYVYLSGRKIKSGS